ncbi:unnamed protein product, partial [Tilletia controversa]
YKPDVSPAQRAEALRVFAQLELDCKLSSGERYIAGFQCGAENVSPEGRGKGFDHGFIITYSDPAHLDYYLNQDPAHIEFKKYIGPLLDDVFIYDFTPVNHASAPSAV